MSAEGVKIGFFSLLFSLSLNLCSSHSTGVRVSVSVESTVVNTQWQRGKKRESCSYAITTIDKKKGTFCLRPEGVRETSSFEIRKTFTIFPAHWHCTVSKKKQLQIQFNLVYYCLPERRQVREYSRWFSCGRRALFDDDDADLQVGRFLANSGKSPHPRITKRTYCAIEMDKSFGDLSYSDLTITNSNSRLTLTQHHWLLQTISAVFPYTNTSVPYPSRT